MKNSKSINFKGSILLVTIVYVVMMLYFLAKRFISINLSSVELIVFIGLLLLLVIIMVVGIIQLFFRIFTKKYSENTKLNGRTMINLLIVLVILAGYILGSQWSAHTPPIQNEEGESLEGSIASIEKVKLGGVDQWLIIRGQDTNNPVMLFLSGGPGASEAARVLRFNQELEKHFTVVIWEQRGCGKSYPSINPKSDLTLAQYEADLIELSELLRNRFDQEKIYLVGHSWGTIIGALAAQSRPDLFHAYIGTAQMVDVLETDLLIYDMVMEHSLKTGDTAFVKTLETQGKPPYLGKSPIQPYSTLFGKEYAIFEVPNIKHEDYRRNGDILLLMLKHPEYSWLDRVYYLLGLMNTFNVVYPQLQDLDLREANTQLNLPVYMVLGRNDMNNPSQIPEDYFNQIDAPSKQLIFFEDSGHGMIWEEAAKFHDLMINVVQSEPYQPE
ncbi:MAG: alpha/beta hydrolase [Chloroflexi bacterium HGW-Chloroflexi-2]|jgi:pimeloyl-ACP methyl ester carboxylesterase|nr:MAG: alpha/beta hydrolase [Chloroflexi bacterium HGW-Chloroflexi-2]